MALTPLKPHQTYPTWGQAYGLLSFQVTGVLIASLLNYLITTDGGILISIVMTILFSALYLWLAESQVPGAFSQRRLRVRIALRATILLSVLSVITTGVYDGARVLESERAGVHGALIVVAILVSYLAMWIGLELGNWSARRKRSNAQAS